MREGKNCSSKISAIKKRDLWICYLLKESASMLEQTSPSYGGLKIGLFVTKRGLFAQFQRAPFGKSKYIYIYNRIEQCALPVTTIMALWQLVNLGTRCTVTHCRIALWSHQSAQTASSERCIMQIVNVSLRDSPPNP